MSFPWKPISPTELIKRQREKHSAAVRVTLAEWTKELEGQYPGGKYAGTIGPTRLTQVERDAADFFRQAGWSVLIRPYYTFNPTYKELLFRARQPFALDIPLPPGCAVPLPADQATDTASGANAGQTVAEAAEIELPTPADLLKRQQKSFEAAVSRTVDNWLKELGYQVSDEATIGTVSNLGLWLSEVEQEAIRRFTKCGWSVKIKLSVHTRTYAFMPCKKLVFSRTV